jgi:hypothetical protein
MTLSLDNISNENTFIIKRGFLDNLPRKLTITPDFIEFQDKDNKINPFTRFDKDSIIGFRHGIKWIRGFEFTVGRDYQIFLQDKNHKILKIAFKTFYGINKQALSETYSQILRKIWDHYFRPITDTYLDKYWQLEPFELCNIHFDQDGVRIKSTAKIFSKPAFIPWADLGTKDYKTYFVVYSTKDPSNVNCSFRYHDDWNVTILYSVIRTIEKYRELDAEEMSSP